MNVINEVTSLLDRGLVVEISGRIVKSNGSTMEEYNTLFYTRAQFDSYYNNLQDTSDIEEWKFTETVKIVETNIRFNKKITSRNGNKLFIPDKRILWC